MVDLASVAAAADGVHVTVIDESGHDLLVRTEAAGNKDLAAGHVSASAGAHILQLPPGQHRVLCSEQDGPEHMLAPSESNESVMLEVTDPTESWVSGVLDCASESVLSEVRDYGAGGAVATEPVTSPADVIREDGSIRLESGDVVEQAGYRGRGPADTTAMRIVRDDRTVAVVGMALVGQWRITGRTSCSDF